MPEQSLPKPLSGFEVRTAIVRDLDRMLALDDRFGTHLAYDGFSFSLALTVTLPSAVQQKVERTLSGSQNQPLEAAETVTLSTMRPVEAPNAVRYDTDQPIPVLTQDEKGQQVEKWVSYAGKDAAGRPLGHKSTPDAPPSVAKVKRNVVKGADVVG